jgi:hypothetical protein
MVDHHYGLVEISKRDRLSNINDVFIFAKQCQQVYYSYTHSFKNDHNRVDWLFIVKIRPRSHVQVVKYSNDEVT